MNRSTLLAIGFIAVTVIYAVFSTLWVSSEPGWYAALSKPSFQPPDVVFGVIWPLNFLALAVVGVWSARQGPDTATTMLGVFVVSVAFALGWAYLFYVPHQLVAAAGCLLVAAILTWVLVALAWQIAPGLGLGLVVYAGWMSVATALATSYARLN